MAQIINKFNLTGSNASKTFDSMEITVGTDAILSESQLKTVVAHLQEIYEVLLSDTVDMDEDDVVINIHLQHINLEI